MDEYINLESLDKDFADQLCCKYPSSYSPGILAAIKEIKRLPVANVREDVKSRWIGVSPLTDSMMCETCGYCIYSEELETPFCPWCGADMREVKENG